MYKLILGVVALLSMQANACIPTPIAGGLEGLPVVVYGEISAVRLVTAEKAFLENRTLDFMSEDASRYEARIMVGKYIKGTGSREIITVEVSDCGVLIPSVTDRGLFFIAKDGKSAVAILSKQGEAYAEWAIGLV